MEHIIQIAIGVDDVAISKIVKEQAAKTIIANIERDVRNKLFSKSYYNKNATADDPLSDFSRELVVEFLEKNKYAIILKTSENLADRLSKTKAAKEALAAVLGGK